MKIFINKLIFSIILILCFISAPIFQASAYPIEATPGVKTIKNLLKTAMLPVGSTLYIWGGGWNGEDTGAGPGGTNIGLMSEWKDFYDSQDSTYNFRDHKFEINNGLDCAGFTGWVIYNVFNIEKNESSFTFPLSNMLVNLTEKGVGTYTPLDKVSDHKPGDIMSGCGHVYIVIGTCDDGSLVLVHSSPPGVHLCGTPTIDGNLDSQAVKLATKYMSTYYPNWHGKYAGYSRDSIYLTSFNQMRWHSDVMVDSDGYYNMNAEEILEDLFN